MLCGSLGDFFFFILTLTNGNSLRQLWSDSTIFSCCFHVWSDLTKWEASNFHLPSFKTQTVCFFPFSIANFYKYTNTMEDNSDSTKIWEQFILKFNLSFDFFKETSISEFVQLGSLQQPLGQKRHIQGQMIKFSSKEGDGDGGARILKENPMGQRMCRPKYMLTSLIQSISILAIAAFSRDVLGFSTDCVSVSVFFSLFNTMYQFCQIIGCLAFCMDLLMY